MRDSQSFDGFAADYDRYAGLEPRRVQDWLLAQLPTRGGRALDAGCGSGRHTKVLIERFDDVVGVDISARLIEIARQRSGPNARYVQRDLMSFSDAEGFDLVLSSTTLHHVPDLDGALMHLRDLVRPGGIAILIDNIASRPTPSRWVHVLGAVRHVPSDVGRLGARQASWLFKFRTSAGWLDHLASDRYLSRQGFELEYESVFAGARFQNLGYAHALVWEKKNPAAVARGMRFAASPRKRGQAEPSRIQRRESRILPRPRRRSSPGLLLDDVAGYRQEGPTDGNQAQHQHGDFSDHKARI